ncbi:vWA domain-containing protein [Roseibium sp.]|uniref:vWA domain-containing protein n=1 Tax=Roseibium sp. TaxID=1936156 RepID=UPI003A9796AC
MISRPWLTVALTVLLFAPALAQDRSTILVLDESGSMWAQLPEGRSRTEVARDVLGSFLTSRDPGQPLGVIAYGHNRRGDCGDIETIAATGIQDGAELAARLRKLMPRGKTPLAASLRRAASEIPSTAEEADIVLVTDGLETCGGDPCAVAAELAREGIPIRAHVVGFGLSEGEVRQISCIAEQTGGMVLATQSGAELADALVRTSQPVQREAKAPGKAALDLTIQADLAGRPDSVRFSASNLDTGETLDLGLLTFAQQWALPVELAQGRWQLSAEAGDQGRGELEIAVAAGDTRTVYVPFAGLMPSLVIDQAGPYRAGASAIFPARITREGIATGGADFVLTLLPPDAQSLEDRRIEWSMQEGREGAAVAQLNMPAAPGRYLAAWHRYGETDLSKAVARLEIEVQTRPDVTLAAPATVEPGALVKIAAQGGGAHNDRIEIWRDGALVSWDQSGYLNEMFDNAYGPAKVLTAPAEPGSYEIVYLFADIDGPDAIATRLPLRIGTLTPADEEGGPEKRAEAGGEWQGDNDPTHGPDEVLAPQDVGYRCKEQFQCVIEDAATGLLFILPAGWFTDQPTREAATAGGEPGLPRLTFYSPLEVPDTIVLNPHQWTEMNGPCIDVQPGRLCRFEPASGKMDEGWEMVRRSIRMTTPRRSPSPAEAMAEAMAKLAKDDPAAAAAMGALLNAAASTSTQDGTPDIGAMLGAAMKAAQGENVPLATCPETTACLFSQDSPSVMGMMPAGWTASTASVSADGRPSMWFSHEDPGGNLKKLGLNQPGGEACQRTALGDLCEFTPYISTQEADLIASQLKAGRAKSDSVGAGEIDMLKKLIAVQQQ